MNMKRLLAFALVVCMALSLLPTTAFAAGKTYYVSESGDDSAEGTSEAPFKTLSKAAAAAGSGDDITLNGNITLTASVTIPESVELTIPAVRTLTVPADCTLTNNGIVNINGTIVTTKADATNLVGTGEYNVAAGANFMVNTNTTYIGINGILTITNGALKIKMTTTGGMDMTVPQDATLTVNGPEFHDYFLNNVSDVITVENGAALTISSGVLFINSGVLNIDGTLSVHSTASLVSSNNASGDQALVSRIVFGPDAVLNGTMSGISAAVNDTHYKWQPTDPTDYNTSGTWKQVVAETYADEACTVLTGYCFSLTDGSATDMVKLICDITLDSDLALGNRRIVTDGHTLRLNSGMTLDGGIFTHTGDANSFAVVVESGSTAALNNVTLSSLDAAPLVKNLGTLTIDRSTLSSSRYGVSGIALKNEGGNLTINSGIFNGKVNTTLGDDPSSSGGNTIPLRVK